MQRVRCILTFAFGVLYLINVFVGSTALGAVTVALLLVVLVMSLLSITGTSRLIAAVFLGIGAVLLALSGATGELWVKALMENAQLIAMFIMVPLIAIPVRHGGYLESLQSLFSQHAGTRSRYYGLVSLLTSLLGVLVSIASVPLAYEVSQAGRFRNDTRLLSTALSRGFATCLVWSPTCATAALALSLTGANWLSFLPAAVACCLAAGAVGWAMVALRGWRGSGPEPLGQGEQGRLEVGKLMQLLAFSAAFIGIVMTTAGLFGFSVIVGVALASLAFPLVWMACIRRLPEFAMQVREDYVGKRLPQFKGQVTLFTAAGVLACGINASGLGEQLVSALMHLIGHDVLTLTILVLALGILLSAVGVHPIVYTTVIGGSLASGQVGVTPEYLALLLCVTWALGNAACPTSANSIAVSQLTECSPFKLALNWNVAYVVAATIVVVALLTAMRLIGVV